ncbi:MAG TPA: amidase, partial [Candidatus Binatia bacterium]|nr:amidase [Candidatus Binatia bacterium]
MTLHEASEKLRKREVSSQELTEAVFQRVAQTDGIIRSYITLCRDTAIAQAKEADKRLKQGPSASPLLGIPIALKDNLLTQGLRTTCASRILENFIPPYDATAVAKVRSAGAVITGKTNLDEFAMGS